MSELQIQTREQNIKVNLCSLILDKGFRDIRLKLYPGQGTTPQMDRGQSVFIKIESLEFRNMA